MHICTIKTVISDDIYPSVIFAALNIDGHTKGCFNLIYITLNSAKGNAKLF